MSKRAHTPEQIIQRLREAEVELAQGATVPAVCRKIGVTDQTYFLALPISTGRYCAGMARN